MMSDGDDDYGEYEVRGSARRRRPHISGFMSSESHELESDSEAEVESLLILSPSRPNVERRGRPRGRSKRRRPRQCLSSGSSDSERAYGSEFEVRIYSCNFSESSVSSPACSTHLAVYLGAVIP
ncbi:hypothetical protein BT96DRAFT_1008845 [Gymnopus androsaceus JB14]|uniref:Uncharacterized protein n=1 Tax=Gymnopus androsaceus JB14 TaxID=1447944 RepID=A0A6A4GE41_9AGAR|nr:hypothetical protein BT96DRAFT_1008845 [Gymnopus androsaceus JB14]